MAENQNIENGKKGMPMSAGGVKILLAGLGIMVLGFVILAGGGSGDPKVFDYSMFDFRRLVIAPVVIAAGVVVQVVGIMKKNKEDK